MMKGPGGASLLATVACIVAAACTSVGEAAAAGAAHQVDANSSNIGSSTCAFRVANGVNCFGNDIASKNNVATADECCAFCMSIPTCIAWTWNGNTNKDCYAKTSCPQPKPADTTSGLPPPPPPKPFFPFRNESLDWASRVNNLISLLNITEKTGFLATAPPGIARLGINPYSYELECNSGACGGSGGSVFYNACDGTCDIDNVTAFPQSSGMACTWNTSLIEMEGTAIGAEVRAISANRFSQGSSGEIRLSCFSPMINIMRNPLWCRNTEGYSECPVLTGELAAHMVRGMQGYDPRYLQVVAGCKHFVPYDGQASDHSSDYDLFATYMVAFQRCLDESAKNIMCSYTKTDYAGTTSCTNKRILTDLLRTHFKWDGFIISDLGAVSRDNPDSLAAGMDVYLGGSPNADMIQDWLNAGTLTMDRLDAALFKSLMPRFLEGEFDPPEKVPYWNTTVYSCDSLGKPAHRQLAQEAALQSIVMLKNDGVLPLPSAESIAVIGPFGNYARWMYNRYSHVPPASTGLLVSLTDALQASHPDTSSAVGCKDFETSSACSEYDEDGVKKAIENADTIIVTIGNGESLESETTCENVEDGIALAQNYTKMVDLAISSGRKVVVILFSTAPKNGDWIAKANAVIAAHYPQTYGGIALARILTGEVSPSGKLAATWPVQLGPFPPPGKIYSSNYTYRYTRDTSHSNVLFPFGFGLSYTEFQYSSLQAPAHINPCDNITITVTVSNIGNFEAAEIVQVYITWTSGVTDMHTPQIQLAGFTKVIVQPGSHADATIVVKPRDYAILTDASVKESYFLDLSHENDTMPYPVWMLQADTSFKLYVGGQQPNQPVQAPSNILSQTVEIMGASKPINEC